MTGVQMSLLKQDPMQMMVKSQILTGWLKVVRGGWAQMHGCSSSMLK